RKTAMCTHCKAMMYTGDKNLNHKKNVCADGVAQKPKPRSSDSLPEWPQPQGIFSAGRFFDPSKFLFTVRDLYEKVMDHTQSPGATADYMLQDEAFSCMLQSRTTFVDGHAFFLLYDLESVRSSCESLISELDGRRYIRIDCL
ncbi:hypothetical protein BDZ97DRAFT_1654345, partial [Flammula alnicola]